MVHSGRATVATAGTKVALATERTMCGWLTIHANASNTGYVYVGGTEVVNNGGSTKQYVGHPLVNGDFVSFRELGGPAYIDLRYIYVDSDSNGNKVTFNYGVR